MDDPAFRAKVAALEVDLMALEFTELRSLAAASAGGAPGPESSIMKLKGTEIQQRIAKLTVEAGGIYSAGWGAPGRTRVRAQRHGELSCRAAPTRFTAARAKCRETSSRRTCSASRARSKERRRNEFRFEFGTDSC